MRKWQIGQVDVAKQLLAKSAEHLPSNENLMVLAAKLEVREGNYEQARKVLLSAKENSDGLKSWLWLIRVLCFEGKLEEAA